MTIDMRRVQRARDHVQPRPEIVLSADQPAVTDAAIAALATMGGIYVHARQLVHVVRDRGAPDWMRREAAACPADPRVARRLASWDGVPTIVPIEREHLADLLGRAAQWISIRTTKKGTERHPASQPPWLAGRIMAAGQWPFPQLEAISDAPVFRADGTIHDVPGYDERTRVIFDAGDTEFPPVPDAPTREDAARALAELLDPFSEFPFKAACDRTATAALILSQIARAAIDGCVPMFGVQAPTPGSGKGLLASAATMIATGRGAPLMSPTEEDEETRKRLLAIALSGAPVVVIDNVDGELGSAPLAMAITAGEVTDRLLGGTKMVTMTLRPVWAFTGNNVRLKGDLGRRVIPIDIDPKLQNPEDRTFARDDLPRYIIANRPRLVVAALTVLRAFAVAGMPWHGKSPKGSFESWDRLVRGAIMWAGGADPRAGEERIRLASDEDLERLRALLGAWRGRYDYTAKTIVEAIADAGQSGDLFTALAAYCPRTGKPEARPVGNAIRHANGRVVDGMRFHTPSKDRTGVALWAIERIPTAGSAGSAGSVFSPSREESI